MADQEETAQPEATEEQQPAPAEEQAPETQNETEEIAATETAETAPAAEAEETAPVTETAETDPAAETTETAAESNETEQEQPAATENAEGEQEAAAPVEGEQEAAVENTAEQKAGETQEGTGDAAQTSEEVKAEVTEEAPTTEVQPEGEGAEEESPAAAVENTETQAAEGETEAAEGETEAAGETQEGAEEEGAPQAEEAPEEAPKEGAPEGDEASPAGDKPAEGEAQEEEKAEDGLETAKANEETAAAGEEEQKAEEGEQADQPTELAPPAQEGENKPADTEGIAGASEVSLGAKGPEPPTPTPEPQKESHGTETVEGREQFEVDPQAVSPGPHVNLDANVTVKFVLMPSGQVATLACTLGQTLSELKAHFAAELKMPANTILLMFDGKNMNDKTTLADLGVGPNGTVQLEMQSADPVNAPIKPYRPRQEYHMPDVITVRVPTEDGKDYRDVVVEIERTTSKKPFLGGYKHKKTMVEYHHASAQTMQKRPPESGVQKFCRDTQTVQQQNMRMQTTEDTSTQMTKIGVFVSNMTDKLVVPGKYTTADQYHAMILQKVIIIQKYYRRWLAKRYVQSVREDRKMRLEWERKEEIRKKKEKEDRIKREFERRMNPKSKEDFDLLYHALEQWRQEELDRINSSLSGAERKAALCQLLEQETQLIASIGRHKLEADSDNKSKNIEKFLEKAAAPKRWKSGDGKYTEMDTPFTIRAQELKDIYNSINMKYLTQDERLDVLLTLKHTVKEHDCKLTQEIIELIDREADLLMRGVKENNLEGLRKRISTLFLQYIKTPTFNPEAARLLKVPQDPSTLRKNIYYCRSCNSYLPSTEFQLSSNSRTVGKCRNCMKIDNDARVRQDLSHYRFMLKTLRRSEEQFQDGAKIAFLLQESDLRYLIENVWNTQSVLSAWEDLYDLVLCRWDKFEEWAPWNCVLLTKDEASAHMKLENLEEGYGQVLIHKVKHKHTLARNYFSRLPGMAEYMHQKSKTTLANQDQSSPSIAGKAVPKQMIKA